jgi:group I intron endonuclease
MIKICGIYSITNKINNKRYIGKSKNIKVRFRNHRSDLHRNKHHSIHLNRSWLKYGKENFLWEILEECSKENLKKREIYWVRFYKSDMPEFGYNGDTANEIETRMEHSEEVCQIIRDSKIGELNYISKLTWEKVKEIRERYKGDNISQEKLAKEYGVSRSAILHVLLNNTWVDKNYIPFSRERGSWNIGSSCSEEAKKKISDANKGKSGLKGEKNPMFGKHLSEETKKKISEALTGLHIGEKNGMFGKHHTEEAKRKNREAHLGKQLSEETRKKISEANRGENNYLFGKHPSEETRKKMSLAHSGENSQTAILTWPEVAEIREKYSAGGISQRKLAKEYGVTRGCIQRIIDFRSWKLPIQEIQDLQEKQNLTTI